jgi:hypothetical protein
MLRPVFLPLVLLSSACATAPQRLHVMPHDKDPHQSALCMAPNGEGIAWVQDGSVRDPATGEALYTCPAPAFFVLMPRCAPGELGFMDETPEHRLLRIRFGRDGSLHGDTYAGRRFCMPAPPH